jgi:hypothetical protein
LENKALPPMLQQLHVLIVAENTSTKCMAFYRDYVLVVVKMSINALVYYKQMQTLSAFPFSMLPIGRNYQ